MSLKLGRHWRGAAGAALACAISSGAAGGAETIGLDIQPMIGAHHWEAPRFRYGREDVRGSVVSEQVGQFAVVPGFRMSYEPGQLFVVPEALGKLRYFISYSRLDNSATANNTLNSATNPFLVAIDGSVAVNILTPANTSLQVDHTHDAATAGVSTEYELSPGFTFGPSLGIAFGQSRQRYRMRIQEVGIFNNSANETVRRNYIGPTLSMQFAAELLDGVKLTGGAGGGAIWSRARLTGDDCADFGSTPGSCDGGFYRTNVDRTFNSWGWRADANLGLAVAIGVATVSVEGIFDAEYARQRIANPTNPGSAPATLVYDTLMGYGGRVSLTYPF